MEFDHLGGFTDLKKWLTLGRTYFPSRRDYGLSLPKGVLLMGISGIRGKSLCVKAISAFWHLPLLRLKPYGTRRITRYPQKYVRKVIKISEASSQFCG